MKLLLDTHLLLWAALALDALPPKAQALMSDPDNRLLFSPVSIWEVAIKTSLKRPEFSADPRLLRRALLDNDYEELSITGEHATAVADLPLIHRDPFDRFLIAQALAAGVMLVTADDVVARYPGPIMRV